MDPPDTVNTPNIQRIVPFHAVLSLNGQVAKQPRRNADDRECPERHLPAQDAIGACAAKPAVACTTISPAKSGTPMINLLNILQIMMKKLPERPQLEMFKPLLASFIHPGHD
jgi:hypothetical protein